MRDILIGAAIGLGFAVAIGVGGLLMAAADRFLPAGWVVPVQIAVICIFGGALGGLLTSGMKRFWG